MSIQLSIYWQTASQLSWYWTEDDQQYLGTLEEMLDQVQKQNLSMVSTRLYLPTRWFTTFPLSLPKGHKRASAQMIAFAAEEYLAQDIEEMHLVMVQKPVNGSAVVTATDKDQFFQIVQTLKARNIIVLEAYDAGLFTVPSQGTHDVALFVEEDVVSVHSESHSSVVHQHGFPQWFEHWHSQSIFDESLSIIIYSQGTEGNARHLVTSLESNGHKVQWVVQEPSDLSSWGEQLSTQKQQANLITASLRPKKDNATTQYWLPGSIAAALALVVWSASSIFTAMHNTERANQTWAASEAVFKQVFGSQKRIQRPLMVREMRNLASSQDGDELQSEPANALLLLNDLRSAEENLLLEDFRFNQARHEAFFTLATSVEGDAFNNFEALKNTLMNKGYEVEYSASKDRDAVRAKFKSVKGG